jgi:hypothetical protein
MVNPLKPVLQQYIIFLMWMAFIMTTVVTTILASGSVAVAQNASGDGYDAGK